MNNLLTKYKITISTIVIAIVLAIVIYVTLKFTGVLKSKQETKEENEYKKNIENEMSGTATISRTIAKTYADRLYTAMKGLGTDEDTIFSTIEALNTRNDLLLVISEFGIRNKETLDQWLHGDLSASDIRKINDILRQKGINYQF